MVQKSEKYSIGSKYEEKSNGLKIKQLIHQNRIGALSEKVTCESFRWNIPYKGSKLKILQIQTFLRGFYFCKTSHIYVEIKLSLNSKITLSFTDIGKSSPNCEFLSSQLCLLTLFANKILAKISEFSV